jgi:SAM-dependent methyltransferase
MCQGAPGDWEHRAPEAVRPAMRGVFLELAESEVVPEAFEAAALGFLAREIGCEAAFFSVKGSEARPAVIGIDAAAIAHAVRRGSEYEAELMPVKRAALAARGVAVDTDVLGEAGVRRTRYFREVAARVHGRHSLMAYLSWRGQPRAAIMLGRSGSGFTRQELERVEAVLPELAAARAIHGWPWTDAPLPEAPRRGWLPRVVWSEHRITRVPTAEGGLSVRDRDGFREMVATSGERELVWTRANVARPSESGWPYIELFHVAAGLARQRRRALFVGLGGGVAVRQFARSYPGMALDVVEREGRVIELARDWFDASAIPGLTLHLDDGAEFVRQAAPACFDVVIVDAYSNAFIGEFASREFFASARRVLAPGGTVALNVIGRLDGTGDVPAVIAALGAELADVRIVPVVEPTRPHDARELRNLVVIARNV